MEIFGRWRADAHESPHNRLRLLAAGSAAIGIAVLGTLVRRRRRPSLDFGDPAALAAETARSVHNAAKGTVITAIRGAAHSDQDLVASTVRAAMRDAARSGADITAVAAGVVEGAADIAHLLGVEPNELASVAAHSAWDAAGTQGEVAADRVWQLLSRQLTLQRGSEPPERSHGA